MTTLWPIPEDAREALEDGEHVLLKSNGVGGDVVIAFEEHVDDSYAVCDWETEYGWKQSADMVIDAARAVIEEDRSEWVEDYRDGEDGALNFAVGQVVEKTNGRAHPTEAKQRLLEQL